MSALEDNPLNIYAPREPDHRKNFTGERSGSSSWDLKRLHETAHEILNLKSQGFNSVQIASTLGVHEATVKSITNSTLGKEKLTIMRGVRDGEAFDIVKEVQERARVCMRVIDEALEDEQQIALKDKAKIAMDTLKMGGFEAPKKLDARFAHMHMLDATALEAIKLRSRDIAREFGLFVQSVNKDGGNGDGKASSGETGKGDQLQQDRGAEEDKEA